MQNQQQFTPKQLAAYIRQSPETALTFAVDHNPRDVYNKIQRLYGKPFHDWAPGYENTDAAKTKLYNFLLDKVNASADPKRMAIAFAAATRHNPNVKNWTAILK